MNVPPKPKVCLHCGSNLFDLEFNDDIKRPNEWYCVLCTRVHVHVGGNQFRIYEPTVPRRRKNARLVPVLSDGTDDPSDLDFLDPGESREV